MAIQITGFAPVRNIMKETVDRTLQKYGACAAETLIMPRADVLLDLVPLFTCRLPKTTSGYVHGAA